MHSKSIRSSLLFVCLFIAAFAVAEPRQIPIAESVLITGQSSNPAQLTTVGNKVCFTATTATYGEEVWCTDGTSAGTRMVKDIAAGTAGSSPQISGALGNAVIFTAVESGQNKLWRSDGTEAGTWRLGVVPPHTTASSGYSVTITTADTRVFLLVQQETYAETQELWVADDTANSLRKVGVYASRSIPQPVGANGKLYFSATDAYVGPQVWVSDGTAGGTHVVRRNVQCPGASCATAPQSFARIGSTILFTTADGLWKTDGTAAGTMLLKALTESTLIAAGKTVAYLLAAERLWRTDGTAAGTTDAGELQRGLYFRDWQVLADGRLVFFQSGAGEEHVWKSDGTPGSAQFVATVPITGQMRIVGTIGTSVITSGYNEDAGEELWSVDVDNGSSGLLENLDPRVIGSAPANGVPSTGATLGSRTVFPASDVSGRELWITDGAAGGTKLLANIASEPTGGIVSGTVRDAVSSAAIRHADVFICPSGATTCTVSTQTGADGTYRLLGVTPGTYTVVASTREHLTQSYTAITVTAGYETAGVDFSLSRAGSISGTLTRRANGTPVGTTLLVRLNGKAHRYVSSSPTTGEYVVVGLRTGSYTVETYSTGGVTRNGPIIDEVYGGGSCPAAGCAGVPGTAIAVTEGQVTANIDFALSGYGTISGTLRDASNPAVTAREKFVSFHTGGYAIAESRSDAAGRYVSPLLRPGQYYISAASGDGYLGVVYPNKACTSSCDFNGATPVTVTADGTLENVDLLLPQSKVRVAGTVRDSAGTLLANISMSVRNTSGTAIAVGQTTADGRFNLHGFEPGTYYLHALDELHPNVDCTSDPCSVAGATPIVLSAGETETVDVTLRSRLSTFRGTIRDAGGAVPVSPSVSVRATDEGLPSDGSIEPDGSYALSVLTRKAPLYLFASAPGHHRVAYANIRADCASEPCAIPPGATAFTPGDHTNIDFSLARFGSISGTIYDADTGAPAEYVTVRIQPSSGGAPVEIWVNNGRYTWPEAAGSYYVWVEPTHTYHGRVYPDVACGEQCVPTSGTLVVVPDGTDKTGVDLRLPRKTPLGKISGRVIDEAGAGIADVVVYTHSAINGALISARTDAQGYYTINGLITADYRLWATKGAPYFTSVYGGDHCYDVGPCNYSGGTPVQVTAPNTATAHFRLIALRVTSIAPAQGVTTGGTRIVVTGTNFTPAATLSIGGNAATILSRTATQLVALTPSGSGAAHVTVSMPSLAVTLAHAYTYTATAYTDEPLVTGRTALKAMHITELRDAVNALRAMANLAAFNFTDPLLAGKPAKALHILELRTALDQARSALGKPALTYTNALTARSSRIQAIDINELRAGVK